MRKLFSIAFALLIAVQVYAQKQVGQPQGGACHGCVNTSDGSTFIGFTYRKDTCGLNYMVVSQKIGQRFTPPGPLQPVTLSFAGLPPCMIVEKAFLWCDASGTGIPINASITNPNSVTQIFPMTLIGSDQDKCWAYSGTHSYRADVTSIVSGNGNYIFSGFPVGATDDVDGMAMMIIYRDPTVTTEGHILIYDGATVINGGSTTQSLQSINACANSTSANAFMLVADLQGFGAVISMNNSPSFSITEDWWNYVDQTTSQITTAQTNCDFTITSSGDCYNLLMAGLYYQTNSCNVCTPNATIQLNVNATATGGCSSGNLSATASGGQSPYTYTWNPGSFNGPTVNGVPAGTYTVTVSDASGCGAGSDTVTVVVSGYPTAQFALSPTPVAFFPGEICMIDQTVGGTDWIWLVNGLPIDTTNDYCFALPDTGNYCVQLVVANSMGCPDTAEQCVFALGESVISVPNVFTPNADNSNDAFVVTWINLTSLRCEIYDRWGVKIYEWDGLTGSWDGKALNGKPATDGVYYYTVYATTTQRENKELHGFVHLVR
jgi:gliding motility-associated-like protein